MTHSELLLFGERIRNRRDSLNLTQEYVSDELHISLRFYQMIERGEKSVSLNTLTGLSQILNISIDYLLFGDLSSQLDNPIANTLKQLSPRQRSDAAKILQLYLDGCNDVPGSDVTG